MPKPKHSAYVEKKLKKAKKKVRKATKLVLPPPKRAKAVGRKK